MNEKVLADTGSVIMGALGWLLVNAQPVIGTFMLFGGAVLLVYRLIIARTEKKIADLELAKLERESR